jgi:hypothetical protein
MNKAGSLAAMVIWMLLPGCYQVHLLSPDPIPLTPACQRTVNVLAWGLKSQDTKSSYCETQDRLKACERAGGSDAAVADCKSKAAMNRETRSVCEQSNGIDQVRMSRNFGQSLLTVLTFGFWSPVQLKWYCSKPVESGDTIGMSNAAGPAAESP